MTTQHTFESLHEVQDVMQKENKSLVVFENIVYDVTEYMGTHPGGSEFIENELGTHIDEKFEEAEHTKSARKLFKDIPSLGKMKTNDETDVGSDDNLQAGAASHMDGGSSLGCTREFDYSKGLFKQMWDCDWSFEEYYVFINEPKVLVNPVRNLKLFDGYFSFLEIVTMTPWWLIPLFWVPIIVYLFNSVAEHFTSEQQAGLFAFGFVYWTFAEYFIHRFIFHVEDLGIFPRNTKIYAIHFLTHGIHHAFPQDKYRLVFPPTLGVPLFACVLFTPAYLLFGIEFASMFTAGSLAGYVIYDIVHYFLHFCNPMQGYWRQLKVFHMQHHYKNGSLGFGVSSRFWDVFFDTDIETDMKPMLK
uniref:Fatty acid 2-hydroxylase n=1 Tax=Strombidium inclinatum TaxID=197538 RepID=A0A7S3MVI9_9SPIT|mmetsp:Transcript_19819/g.30549  ORF Transcript_19819/g.30549 Transcript_19819/m.30549 type:complete len:359 (+) Transcript_19819:37-1113(+)